MSRIREALKKAEQEKAASTLGGLAEQCGFAVREAVNGDGGTWRAPQIISPPKLGRASETSNWLRLDELRKRCVKPGWRPSPDYSVFSNQQTFAVGAEQFRTLRTHLYRLRKKQPIRTLLVTSALPGEGKSFVALNLAQVIVRQHERRALLIDGDLRASKLHVCMGAPCAPGLADYLDGEVDEFGVLQADQKNDLFLIAAGKIAANPAELLANDRLKSLLDRLAPVFDWIIVDAPPLPPVSDASLLAGLCDGVIFVVRAAVTAYDLAQAACQELREKNLIGVVLNGAEEEIATYGAYSEYSGNGKDKR
jgi:protein-tyrosine kinase